MTRVQLQPCGGTERKNMALSFESSDPMQINRNPKEFTNG
jgi:hypothetical protein